MTASLPLPGRPRARRPLALALQCLPLLAATSCLTRGVLGEGVQQAGYHDLRYLVVISALAWALGYLPLRCPRRWLLAFLAGGAGTLIAANAALGAWSASPDGQGEAALRRAAFAWATLMAAAVALLLLDTWRLTKQAYPGPPWSEPA